MYFGVMMHSVNLLLGIEVEALTWNIKKLFVSVISMFLFLWKTFA